VASPLLETKLYVPRRRRGLVARPRLRQRLDRGVESKLTLVSAPAGFGKTTLLAQWLGDADAEVRRAAWLSLDHSDNHPPSFWSYVLGTDLDGPGIARELTVSLNTIRTHTKNLYGKLGVNNRRAAVTRAEELQLLSRTHKH
jgi:LuxR family maltose regulon positive regulatory protein